MPETRGRSPGEREPLPLGFKLLVTLAGLYLAVRVFEVVAWVLGKLT